MKIKNYSDLKNVGDEMIIDLSELKSKQFIKAINFLAGLTFKKGSLTKLENNKYLVKVMEK